MRLVTFAVQDMNRGIGRGLAAPKGLSRGTGGGKK